MPEPILQEPAAIFMSISAVLLIAPLLSELVHLPGIVGLILGGLLVGRHGLNLLVTGPTIELFGDVGLIYLMCNAGLDIDQFARVRRKAMVFAAMSFLLPQLSGIGLGWLLGLGLAAAILLGSTYASQTLIAYPVLSDLAIIPNDAVSITVGATIFTDIAALLVLGIITGSQDGDVSFLNVAQLIGLTIAYAALVKLVVPRLGELFLGATADGRSSSSSCSSSCLWQPFPIRWPSCIRPELFLASLAVGGARPRRRSAAATWVAP